MQVLESATRLPAEAMGISDRFGTIEAGKKADMVILKEDPLLDLQHLASVAVYKRQHLCFPVPLPGWNRS